MLGNFVPCYRKSDDVNGFYDLVSAAFFGAAAGKLFEYRGEDVFYSEPINPDAPDVPAEPDVPDVPDVPDEPGFTNLADPKSADWKTNSRLGSSGVSDETNGSIVTNYIPCKKGDVVRVSGLNIGWLKSASNARCHFLASDKSILGTSIILTDDLFEFTDTTNQNYAYEWIGTIGNGDSAPYPTIAYIRFCGSLKTTADDVVITVNEEITT